MKLENSNQISFYLILIISLLYYYFIGSDYYNNHTNNCIGLLQLKRIKTFKAFKNYFFFFKFNFNCKTNPMHHSHMDKKKLKFAELFTMTNASLHFPKI